MKILKIYIKNLNSLKGEFEIDFEQHPLKNTGLFLISGRTGAGKTTILDAITLALYGDAPRFDDVKGKAVAEMMTHGTKECCAELTFQTILGVFVANWKMRRTRTGRLSPTPYRELYQVFEDGSTKVLADKVREVNAKVETLLGGLNFNRFKRSIMLAQGDFAQFLKGNEDRSDILERITDTAFYSDISRSAFERFKAEQTALQQLEQQAEGAQPLSKEALAQIKVEQTSLQQQIETHKSSLAEDEKGLNWLNNIAQKQGELQTLNKQQKELHAKKEAFQEQADRLTWHQKAAPLQTELNYFEELKQSIQIEEKEQFKLSNTEDSLTKKIEQLKATLDSLEKELHTQKTTIKKLEPVWEEVKQLDHEIKQLQSYEEERKSELLNTSAKEKEHQNKIDKINTDLNKLAKQLKSIEDWLTKHAHLQQIEQKQLIQDLKGHQKDAEKWQYALKEKEDSLQILLKNKTSKEVALKEALAAQEKFQKAKKKLLKTQKELVVSFDRNLKDSEIEDVQHFLQEAMDNLSLEYKAVDELAKLVQERQEILDELEKVGEEKLSAHIALENLDYYSLNVSDQRTAIKKELDYQNSLCQRLEINMSFEEHREHLKAGEPCPLCFSTEHNLAQQKVSIDSQLSRERKKLERLKDKESQLDVQFEKVLQDISHAVQAFKGYDEQDQVCNNNWDDIQAKTAELYREAPFLKEEWLDFEPDEVKEELQRCEQRSHQLEQTNRSLDQNLKQINEQDHQLAVYNERISALKAEIAELETQQESQEKQLLAIKQEAQQLMQTVNNLLADFGEPLASLEDLVNWIQRQEEQLQLYKDQKEKLQKIQQAEKELQSKLHTQESLLEELSQSKLILDTKYQKLQAQIAEKQEHRQSLLGKEDPVQAQKLARETLEQTQKSIEATQTNHRSVLSDLQSTQTLLKEKANQLKQLNQRFLEKKNSLTQQATQSGFSDLATLKGAMLSTKEAKELQQQQEELAKALAQNLVDLNRATEQLDKLSQQAITDLKMDALQGQINQQKEAIEQLTLQLGEKRQVLKEQQEQRKRQKALHSKIDEQRTELSRWRQLYELIGHAEGKKFRQFAQNITLAKLIHLANKHLQQFVAGRYLLEKREEDSLEIDIIDTYQANNKRPLNTLSGGETFLASLSLALGLSDLAGGRANIESLFIDEGFGTLDSDTLAIALKALQTLQAQGKTIGIISHVVQLKNKIDTQIQVNKKQGGFSQIEMVGG